jgi:hypothetical protein
MCTLIYAVVPMHADLDRLPKAAAYLVPAEDAVVASKLYPGERLCRVEGVPQCAGGGNCGTVLGREALREGRVPEESDAAQAMRLRQKGWTEHKVQRWLAQKREARVAQPPNVNGTTDEMAIWKELLRVALEDAHLRYLGLMVFTAGDEPNLPIRSMDVTRAACDLTRLEQGILYKILR